MDFPSAGRSSSSQFQMTITISDSDEPQQLEHPSLSRRKNAPASPVSELPLPATAPHQHHGPLPIPLPPYNHAANSNISPPTSLSSPLSFSSGLVSPTNSFADLSSSPGRRESLNRRKRHSSSHVPIVNIPPPANPVRPLSLQGPPPVSPPPTQSISHQRKPSATGTLTNQLTTPAVPILPATSNKLFVNTVRSPIKAVDHAPGGIEAPSSPSPLKSADMHQLERRRQSFLRAKIRKDHSLTGPRVDFTLDRGDRERKFAFVRNWPAHRTTLKPSGTSLLLHAATADLLSTYMRANPDYTYQSDHNPRRVLTKPSKPMHNHGRDNEDWDFLLFVNDIIGSQEGRQYRIMDVLGQGTFGQVAKCINIKTKEAVAVKVIKNKPAYHNQSLMEVAILELLNLTFDPADAHHIVRMSDHFMHQNHLCIVFEMLSVNLYELIKQNQFRGLSANLVRIFVRQILDSLIVLNKARIIHCDLKPENILLKNLESPNIKVIDFGSACHENQTVYTYIQSRFYRSPEVLLGLPYTSSIDMWSLGCIAGELFLGLPLFPGSSEYNQIGRIVEMLGPPPVYMCEKGKSARQFFEKHTGLDGRAYYALKTPERYMAESGTAEQPSKRYFSGTTLADVIGSYPIVKKGVTAADMEKETHNRQCFIDFLHGLLTVNPFERWTPQQARMHPFITGEVYSGPFLPQGARRIAPYPPPGLSVNHDSNYREPAKRRPRANTISSLQESLPPQLQRLAAAQRTAPDSLHFQSIDETAKQNVVHVAGQHETMSPDQFGIQADEKQDGATTEGLFTPLEMDSPQESASSRSFSVSDSQFVSARQSTISSVSSRSASSHHTFGDDLTSEGMRTASVSRGDSARTYTPQSSPLAPYGPSATTRDGSPSLARHAHLGGRLASAQGDRRPTSGRCSADQIPGRNVESSPGMARVTEMLGDIEVKAATDTGLKSALHQSSPDHRPLDRHLDPDQKTPELHVHYEDRKIKTDAITSAVGKMTGYTHSRAHAAIPAHIIDSLDPAGFPLRKARSQVIEAPSDSENRSSGAASYNFPLSLLARNTALSESQQLAMVEDALAQGSGQGHPRHGETGERSAVPSRRPSLYGSIEWDPFGDGSGGSAASSQMGSRRGSVTADTSRALFESRALYNSQLAATGHEQHQQYSTNLQNAAKYASMPDLMHRAAGNAGLPHQPENHALSHGLPALNSGYYGSAQSSAHFVTDNFAEGSPNSGTNPSLGQHQLPAGAYRRASAVAINMGMPDDVDTEYHHGQYSQPATDPYQWRSGWSSSGMYDPAPNMHEGGSHQPPHPYPPPSHTHHQHPQLYQQQQQHRSSYVPYENATHYNSPHASLPPLSSQHQQESTYHTQPSLALSSSAYHYPPYANSQMQASDSPALPGTASDLPLVSPPSPPPQRI